MIHVFKAGGNHTKEDGTPYSIKVINEPEKPRHIIEGWVTSLDLIEGIEDAVFEEIEPVRPLKVTSKKG